MRSLRGIFTTVMLILTTATANFWSATTGKILTARKAGAKLPSTLSMASFHKHMDRINHFMNFSKHTQKTILDYSGRKIDTSWIIKGSFFLIFCVCFFWKTAIWSMEGLKSKMKLVICRFGSKSLKIWYNLTKPLKSYSFLDS
jgi:hypothetical protein